MDIVMIQEHKLKEWLLECLGSNLMIGYTNWILEAAPGERNWIKISVACNGGVETSYSTNLLNFSQRTGCFMWM